ncbi:hypothetical protein ACH4TP_32720 [Streptomyces sp. NPDC021012]|uniref:hypothetical protein n=1 Tax=Streptomyces sp. NPDC021012 TaxID=3365107 RepID=UPI0037AD2275
MERVIPASGRACGSAVPAITLHGGDEGVGQGVAVGVGGELQLVVLLALCHLPFGLAIPVDGQEQRDAGGMSVTLTAAMYGQTVNPTASGLPAGGTAAFSLAPVTAGGPSALTPGTTAATVCGTYRIAVDWASASAGHMALLSPTVTGGATRCTAARWVSSSVCTGGRQVSHRATP